MIKFIVLLTSILSIINLNSQTNWTEMTGKQKAFFYQLTRKIENLKPEFFHLLEFTDSIPFINDTLPDYPFVEKQIEADSSKLICHFSDMARKDRGLLMDIGTHFASWELGLILQFRDSEKQKYQYLKPKFKDFGKLVLENTPSASVKLWSDGGYTIVPEVISYFSPNLTILEKIASLKNSRYNAEEKLSLLNAIYDAQEAYIGNRASEIVNILTNKNILSANYLVAAGDGKNWDELESIIRTKYNRPLPDPKGFFNYSIENKRVLNSDDKVIGINQNTILKMATKTKLATNLHVDVWAYHPQRQTTLIIQKGENTYALYGNNDNRYLSPSPSFNKEGITYQELIEELENVWIADLKERIYGKKGFDYLIDQYEKKIVKTRYNIKKTEKSLNKIRYQPEGPPKMKKKKKSKKQRKKGQSTSYQDNQGVPRGKMSKTGKKRQIEQHNLVGYQGQLQTELSTLNQLKKDKEEAFDLLSRYEAQLDMMKKSYGYNLLSYTNDKYGHYTFSDGTIFDVKKQDLVFSETNEEDYFEVILVSFGENVMDKNFEEVFLHLNLNYTSDQDVYTLFHKSESPHTIAPFSTSDSIQIQELFWHLENSKLPTQITTNFILETTNQDTAFQNTITNYIKTTDKTNITLTGIYNQFQPKLLSPEFINISSNYPNLKKNQLATAIEMGHYFEAWKTEISLLAKRWITDPKSQKKVQKAIKKLKLTKITADSSLIKL